VCLREKSVGTEVVRRGWGRWREGGCRRAAGGLEAYGLAEGQLYVPKGGGEAGGRWVS